MEKLQYKYLNKGIELEDNLMVQLKEYDTKVVAAMYKELKSLEVEYEYLKLNGNVITDFNMEEYQQNQRRLRELPTLIANLKRDMLKAKDNKSELKDSLCRGIYSEIGEDYKEEFEFNMEILKDEYDTALTKLIEVNKQMQTLETEYKDGLYNVIDTKGVYLTINRYPFITEVMRNHNLNEKSLYLYYAK